MAKGPSSSDLKKYSSQTLKVGSKGPAVECLQGALNKSGAKLDVDGKFGSGTKKAVQAFQKKKKLSVDGIVGPQTWAALSGKTPPKSKDAKLQLWLSDDKYRIPVKIKSEVVVGSFSAELVKHTKTN